MILLCNFKRWKSNKSFRSRCKTIIRRIRPHHSIPDLANQCHHKFQHSHPSTWRQQKRCRLLWIIHQRLVAPMPEDKWIKIIKCHLGQKCDMFQYRSTCSSNRWIKKEQIQSVGNKIICSMDKNCICQKLGCEDSEFFLSFYKLTKWRWYFNY